jgi:DNA-binding response OmpR family regulator
VREADGADAALAAAEWTPDFVLADEQLGAGARGAELVARLRAAHGACLSAAILTGQSEGPALAALRASGLTVLRKPARPAQLRALLSARPTPS